MLDYFHIFINCRIQQYEVAKNFKSKEPLESVFTSITGKDLFHLETFTLTLDKDKLLQSKMCEQKSHMKKFLRLNYSK